MAASGAWCRVAISVRAAAGVSFAWMSAAIPGAASMDVATTSSPIRCSRPHWVAAYARGRARGRPGPLPRPEIAALAAAITARLAELADQLTERISQSVDAYGPDAVVPLEDLRTSCRNRQEFLFDQFTRPGPVDLTVPGRPADAAPTRAPPS